MSGRAGPASVRRARASDLPALVSLWVTITDHHAGLGPAFRLRPGAEPEICELLRAQLRDPDTAIFVRDEADAVVGMCIVRMDRAPPILEETARAEITDLGVRSDRRRCGVGRALADAALCWAAERGVARVEARVAATNHEGQAFWRALGFGDLMDVLERRL